MNTFTHTEENYLKTIFHLSIPGKKPVTTSALAESLKTTSPSVTDMVKRLSEKGLIKYTKYYGVSLTENGRKAAVNIIRRHRLWEAFLVKALEFKWDEVHAMAEELEHVSSDELIRRIDKYLGYPKTDPHGDPIPDEKGKITTENFIALTELKENDSALMAGVIDHSSSLLKYLEKNNIHLNSKIKVEEVHEFDKSVDIIVNQKTSLHISHDIAKNLLVKK